MNYSMNVETNNLIMQNHRQTDKYYEENAIIKPPLKSETPEIPKKSYRYVIDSRDRHLTFNNNPNSYEIKLSEDITEVESVELVSYDIPFTKYLINNFNNTFHYEITETDDSSGTETTETKTIKLDSGDYSSGDSICVALNDQQDDLTFEMNSLNDKINITYTASHVKLTCKGGVEKKNDYDLVSPIYKSRLMKLLGLGINDVSLSDPSTSYVFPYKIDMRKDKYIIICLEQAELNFSENTATHHSFAIVKKDDMENKYIDTNYKMKFSPPIVSLKSIKLSFKDYDGNLYDFQNQDHMLELQFTCYTQPRRYQDIFG